MHQFTIVQKDGSVLASGTGIFFSVGEIITIANWNRSYKVIEVRTTLYPDRSFSTVIAIQHYS